MDVGDITGAQAALLEALTLARELEFPMRTAPQQGTYSATVLAYAFEVLAALAAQTAEHEKGALLLGAAQGRPQVGGEGNLGTVQALE